MGLGIRAGYVCEINQQSGDWLFVDIGFAAKRNKSCGVLKNDGNPWVTSFGGLISYVTQEAQALGPPLNLLIEAPLSATFDKDGNPTGRSIDKRGEKHRYWHEGPAGNLIVATGHLLRRVKDCRIQREVRLFEGFASFKPSGSKSDHKYDALRLRCSARYPKQGYIVRANGLKIEASHTLKSALAFAGMDYGIPPVVIACDHPYPHP